tara:strand:+ start:2089 stop:2967 length:879 start_codon:yes stop_codon:yes gene_type:complete
MKILAHIALLTTIRQPLPRLGSMSLNAYRSAASIRSTSEIERALAAQQLKNDPEYVTAQLLEGDKTLHDVDPELTLNNPQLRQAGLKANGLDLKLISNDVQTIDDVLAAVESNGLALEFINPKFANDENILLTAVKQNGAALEFVNQSVANEQPELYSKLVAEAIKISLSAYTFAPEDVLNDIRDKFLSKVYNDYVEYSYDNDIDDDENCYVITPEKANELIRNMPACKYDVSELYERMIQYFDHDRIVYDLDEDAEEKLLAIFSISQGISLKSHIDILKENCEGEYNFIRR